VGKLTKAPVVLGIPWVATAIALVVATTLGATGHPTVVSAFNAFWVLLVASGWSTFAYCGGYADGKDTK